MDVRNKVQASVSESNMNNDEKGLGEKATEDTDTCDYCDFISDNDPELKLHLATAHDGLIFQCSQCEVTDIEKDTVLYHVREAHVGSEQTIKASRNFSNNWN